VFSGHLISLTEGVVMQVKLNEDEIRQQMEIEAYDKMVEEEQEIKKINEKAKRKKADKKFQIVMFSLIGIALLIVVLQYLQVF
jgi:hypothetical protein